MWAQCIDLPPIQSLACLAAGPPNLVDERSMGMDRFIKNPFNENQEASTDRWRCETSSKSSILALHFCRLGLAHGDQRHRCHHRPVSAHRIRRHQAQLRSRLMLVQR